MSELSFELLNNMLQDVRQYKNVWKGEKILFKLTVLKA